MGPIYSLQDFLDMTKRRFWTIVGVIILGCVASLSWALSYGHLFHSHEVIQIERPKISDELARSTVEGSSARRLQLIQQQLMARSNLLEVIEKYGLYADRGDMPVSEKVNYLRDAVEITSVAAVREGFGDDGTISVMTIRAEMDTPEMAQAIAHEFGERTRELARSQRREQTEETLAFFSIREQALRKEIATLEAEIEAYRIENELTSEGRAAFILDQIGSLNDGILEIDRAIIAAELAKSQIDRNDRAATVQRAEKEIDGQLATLKSQRNLLDTRREDLRAQIQTTPEVERDLDSFQRRMQRLQSQYDVISTRRGEAEVGFSLEEGAQGERLTTLEEAPLPDYPVTASRKKRAIMGAMASIAAAFVLAWLLEFRRPVIRTAKQMKRETGVMPVVAIPPLEIDVPKESRRDQQIRGPVQGT